MTSHPTHSDSEGDRAYIELLQDREQRMRLTGDALATALSAFLGPDHQLIRMWDEAKD